MRVLIVAAWPPWPRSDGASLMLAELLEHLAPRHEITVLAAARPPGVPMPDLDEAGIPPGVRLMWCGSDHRGAREYARRRWLSFRSGEPVDAFRVDTRGMRQAFAEEIATRPDILHLHGWSTAHFVARAGEVPVVHMAIDAWQALHNTQMALPAWRRFLETGQRRKIVRHESRYHPRCFAVAAVAPRDAEILKRSSPTARIEVIQNGVDLDKPMLGPAADPVLGFHGALSTVTNRDAALVLARDVLPRVRASVPDARALLIGRDPGPELLELASSDIEVTGEVGDVWHELSRVAVYVAPMVSGTGLKFKVMEAMAAGLPVVATERALNGIGEGPGVLRGETPEELATHVVRLLREREAARALGEGGRARAERDFTWERATTAVETLWKEAVRARASGRSGPARV